MKKRIQRVRDLRKMANCESCDHRVDSWMLYCPHCGDFQLGAEDLDTDCKDCGRSIRLTMAFCPYCGDKTNEKAMLSTADQLDGIPFDELCPHPGCAAPISGKMLYCVACGTHQDHFDDFDEECANCETGAHSKWDFCVWCGAYGLMDQGGKKKSA